MLVTQLCPTLCDPMDCSPPVSSVMRFSRQGYWSTLPFPSPGDIPNPGIEPRSPTLQADSLLTELQGLVKKIIKYVLLDVESRKKNETNLCICRNRENCWLLEAEVERKKKKPGDHDICRDICRLVEGTSAG